MTVYDPNDYVYDVLKTFLTDYTSLGHHVMAGAFSTDNINDFSTLDDSANDALDNDGTGGSWDGSSWKASWYNTDYDKVLETFPSAASPESSQDNAWTILNGVWFCGTFNGVQQMYVTSSGASETDFARVRCDVAVSGSTHPGQAVVFDYLNAVGLNSSSGGARMGALLQYSGVADTGYAVVCDASRTAAPFEFDIRVYSISAGTVTELHETLDVEWNWGGGGGASNVLMWFRVQAGVFSLCVGTDETKIWTWTDSNTSRFSGEYSGVCGDKGSVATNVALNEFRFFNIDDATSTLFNDNATPESDLSDSTSEFNDTGDTNVYQNIYPYVFCARYRTESNNWKHRASVEFTRSGTNLKRWLFPRSSYSNSGNAFVDNFTDGNGTTLASHTPDTGTSWAVGSLGSGLATIQSNAVRFYGQVDVRDWLALGVSGVESWHNYLQVNILQSRLDNYVGTKTVRQGLVVRYWNQYDITVAYLEPIGTLSAYLRIATVTWRNTTQETTTVLASVPVSLGDGTTWDQLAVWDLNGHIYVRHQAEIDGVTIQTCVAADAYDDVVSRYEIDGTHQLVTDGTWGCGLYAYDGTPFAGYVEMHWDSYVHTTDASVNLQADDADTDFYAGFVPVIGADIPPQGLTGTDLGFLVRGTWLPVDDYDVWYNAFAFLKFNIPAYYFYSINQQLPAFIQTAFWLVHEGPVAQVLAPLQQEAFWVNIASMEQTLQAMQQAVTASVPPQSVSQIDSLLASLRTGITVYNPQSVAEVESILPTLTQSIQASYDYVYEAIQDLPAFQQSLAAAGEHAGAISTYLAMLLTNAEVYPENSLDVESVLQAMVSSATGPASSAGQINQQLQAMVSEAVVEISILSNIAQSLQPIKQEVYTASIHLASISSDFPAMSQGMEAIIEVEAAVNSVLAAIDAVAIGRTDFSAQVNQVLKAINQAAAAAADYEATINQALQPLKSELDGSTEIGSSIAQRLEALNLFAEATGTEFEIRQNLVALQMSAFASILTDTEVRQTLQAMTQTAESLNDVAAAINTGLGYLQALSTVQAIDDATINSVLSAMSNAGQIKVEERGIYRILLKVFAAKSLELKTEMSDELKLKVYKDEMRHL